MSAGDPHAAEELMPFVYDDLRALAAAYLRRERPDHTLQPTALVHETFFRLIGERDKSWEGRAHFCAVAATAMRRLLIDHARRRKRSRLAREARVDLTHAGVAAERPEIDLLALDEALAKLGRLDPRWARIVELRFFGGLTNDEVARLLEVSVSTIEKDWRAVRAWLLHQFSGDETA